MNGMQAIKIANDFLREQRGIEAHPVQVKFVQRPELPSFWVVRYGTAILFPKETAAGSKVDGGDYLLKVDDTNGVVTVLE